MFPGGGGDPASVGMRPGTRSMVVGAVALTLMLSAGVTGGAAAAEPDAFDPATLCPDPSPTSVELAGVLDELSARARDRSAVTGITTRIESVDDWGGAATRGFWRYSGDPVARRQLSTYRETNTDIEQEFLPDRAVYEDLTTHRRYTRLLLDSRLTEIQYAAVAEYGKSSAWLRTSTQTWSGWPWDAYLDPMSTRFAGRIRTDLPGAALSCSVSGSEMTVVATTPNLSRTLTLSVDDEGAPVEFRLTGAPLHFLQWHGTVDYARPTLPARSRVITPAQFRTLATRYMVKAFRGHGVHNLLAAKVAAQPTHAKRVAVLRKGLKALNADFVKTYNHGTSTGVTSTGKNVTGGRKYTIRCGAAIGTVTFTVKGKKIVTKTVLPPRP